MHAAAAHDERTLPARGYASACAAHSYTSGGAVEPDVPIFTELVNRLFATHPNPKTGREYTAVEIVVVSQGEIAEGHLRRLRKGRIRNPTRETLLALCRVFRVQPIYFFPELADETDLTLS